MGLGAEIDSAELIVVSCCHPKRSEGPAVAASRSRTHASLDRLYLFPIGLAVAHRFKAHRFQDRLLERLLVDRMDVQSFLAKFVGELAFALFDVGRCARSGLARDVDENLLVGIG